MEMNDQPPHDALAGIRRRGRQKMAGGLNAFVAVVLAFALVVMVNYLSSRHFRRYDWSRSKYYSLSDKTKSLLASLTNRIDVVVFFQPNNPVYEDVDNLLKEYEAACPRLHVERVDPDRNLARTEELARKYDVKVANVVVFDNHGRSKYVTGDDVVDMDYSRMLQGGSAERVAFKGELAFSSALQSVTQDRKPIVYFVRGHGERDVDDRDPYTGFSSLQQKITRDNVEVRTLTLGAQPSIPADADALIMAGPTRRFAQTELDLLRTYVEKQGRLMVLLDADTHTGIEPLLETWGIHVGDDVVVDPTHSLSGMDLFVTEYGTHPITRHLRNVTSVFYTPRSVEAVAPEAGSSADKPRATSLVSSSPDSWAELDLDQKPMRYDTGRDRKGPVSIAAAAERGSDQLLDVDIRPSRLVVFGDSDFASNGALTGGNGDLLLSALNWLLEREQLMAIAPKPTDELRLIMDGPQLSLLFWCVVVGLPGLAATAGALVWLKRRS